MEDQKFEPQDLSDSEGDRIIEQEIDKVKSELQSRLPDLEAKIADTKDGIIEREERLKTLDADSPEAVELREEIENWKVALEGWQREIGEINSPPHGTLERDRLEALRSLKSRK